MRSLSSSVTLSWVSGDAIITAKHAFVVYKLVAAVFGAESIEVPGADLRHDLDAMLAAVTPKTRLIFIANPNNPTGTLEGQKRDQPIHESTSGKRRRRFRRSLL